MQNLQISREFRAFETKARIRYPTGEVYLL
jgi:hypothetical protein